MALRARLPSDPAAARRLEAAGFELMLNALHPDREQAGEKYQLLRMRLIDFFAWRGARGGDELADETMDRVCRRLAGGEVIRADAARYVLGIARNVLREAWARQRRSSRQALDTVIERVAAPESQRPGEERRMSCLERCLERLAADDRELLLRYYEGHGTARIAGRQDLAARTGLAPGTLRVRLHRLRVRLEGCVRACLGSDETPVAPRPPMGEE